MNALELYLQTAAQMGTAILFATLGGILCEKVDTSTSVSRA